MIVIRTATLADVPFIRRLTLEAAPLSVPEGRDIPNRVVVERTAKEMDDIDLLVTRETQFVTLVAVDSDRDDLRVGFLILEFAHIEPTTGESQSYIPNMAVEPAYWGKFVGHELVRAAARVTSERGFRYMTANVTASNQRSVLSCLQVGFEIERHQIVMACGPEGPLSLPGRPLAQRAHAMSRLHRKGQRRAAAARRSKANSNEPGQSEP